MVDFLLDDAHVLQLNFVVAVRNLLQDSARHFEACIFQ